MTVRDVNDVLVIAAWLSALLFVLRYLRTKWFTTPMGIHAMAFMAALLIILSLAASYVVWGPWASREWLRLVSYSLINIVLWWRLWMLYSGQRPERKHPTHPDDPLR